jgi:hypothetical protein
MKNEERGRALAGSDSQVPAFSILHSSFFIDAVAPKGSGLC